VTQPAQQRTIYWVDRDDLPAFYTPRPTYAALVRCADEGIGDFLKDARPYARVCLLRIQPRGKGDFLDGVSRPLPGKPNRVERLIAEQPIYDLSSLGKAMCLAVGRNSDCPFKPVVDLSNRFFSQPHPVGLGYTDELDTTVSREHAWIVYEGAGSMLFCVVGTPEAAGNGALIEDEERVTARTVPWKKEQFIGIGQVCKNTPDPSPPYISIFRMRYVLQEAQRAAETLPAP